MLQTKISSIFFNLLLLYYLLLRCVANVNNISFGSFYIFTAYCWKPLKKQLCLKPAQSYLIASKQSIVFSNCFFFHLNPMKAIFSSISSLSIAFLYSSKLMQPSLSLSASDTIRSTIKASWS